MEIGKKNILIKRKKAFKNWKNEDTTYSKIIKEIK